MAEKRPVSYPPFMKKLFLAAGAVGVFAAVFAVQACSSSSNTSTTSTDAGQEGGGRVLACAPATDAGVAKAEEAGVTAKILKPTNGQKFSTTEKVTLQGTGSDPVEGSITDPTRTIWNVGKSVEGVSPDGEGPEDTSGPYPAGTYIVRFDVSNKACLTAADSVTITVE